MKLRVTRNGETTEHEVQQVDLLSLREVDQIRLDLADWRDNKGRLRLTKPDGKAATWGYIEHLIGEVAYLDAEVAKALKAEPLPENLADLIAEADDHPYRHHVQRAIAWVAFRHLEEVELIDFLDDDVEVKFIPDKASTAKEQAPANPTQGADSSPVSDPAPQPSPDPAPSETTTPAT